MTIDPIATIRGLRQRLGFEEKGNGIGLTVPEWDALDAAIDALDAAIDALAALNATGGAAGREETETVEGKVERYITARDNDSARIWRSVVVVPSAWPVGTPVTLSRRAE